MSQVTFGNITLPHGLALAPLAGVSDRAFRRVCRACGADFTVSEMVSAKALCYEQKAKKKEYETSASAALASVFKGDEPLAIQIFGSEPEFMAEAAAMLESGEYRGCISDASPAAIDINMGCPVKKIVSNGEGSALMKTPALAADRLKEIIDTCKEYFAITEGIGLELHPDNVTVETLQKLKSAGVTKISIGIQSFQEKYQSVLGRKTVDRAAMAEALSAVPFETVSMDFIFALPGQTYEDLKADVDAAFASGANHIAIYPFIDFTFTKI